MHDCGIVQYITVYAYKYCRGNRPILVYYSGSVVRRSRGVGDHEECMRLSRANLQRSMYGVYTVPDNSYNND